MLLVLFALFFRPVGFEYRSKIKDSRWRAAWDWGLFVGGFVPALVFGVAFGNLLQGVPFQYDEFMRPQYTGSFWGLLNPFALLAGIISLTMLVMHGAVYLQMRTEGDIQARAKKAVRLFGVVFIFSRGLEVDLTPLGARGLEPLELAAHADGGFLGRIGVRRGPGEGQHRAVVLGGWQCLPVHQRKHQRCRQSHRNQIPQSLARRTLPYRRVRSGHR